MLKAIIVDDEIGAIKNLQQILKENTSEIEVISYAVSTKDAELKIKLLKPDVVFLDIDMPHETGIEFLKRLNFYDFEVVFVTAYNEFAIQAFKLNAIDYILKPIDLSDLKHCISRLTESQILKENYKNSLTRERLTHLGNGSSENSMTNILLRCKEKIEVVPFELIQHLHADGAYTIFYYLTKGKLVSTIMSYPLAHYEQILPSKVFLRVHNSYIVNTRFIKEIIKDSGYNILTSYGEKIPISKRRVQEILDQLKR